MSRQARTQAPVEQDSYTEEYFRSSVEGHVEFAASGGRTVSPRLARALRLARLRPGQRVLDIACGRGEVVLQSALRGAYAVGIDYAAAAMAVARDAIAASRGATALARMDATRLALRPATFDAAFMLDFVEHVHQPDLECAVDEVRSALRPGGRLVIHTLPNRIFDDFVYRNYVVKVHGAILDTAQWLGLEEGLFLNEITLPIKPQPLRSSYEQELHVNPQDARSLRDMLHRHKFRVRRVDYYQPPARPFFPRQLYWHNALMKVLDVVRFLYPLGRVPPLDRFFSNHIWVVAERC